MNKRFVNLDADESIFFERELESVKSKSYDVQYPELMARKLIPVSSEAGNGAETIKYEQYDMVGMAKIISNYAHDLPRADVKGKEFISPVRSIGDAYGYNVQEVRAAKMAGKPLEQRRANAAKKAAMELENKIAFFGDAETGLKGLFTAPNITEVTIPNDGTGSSKLWSAKTPAQILRDMNLVANSVSELTKMMEIPDTMLLPVARFNYVNSTARSDQSDKTILKYFLENQAYIKNVQPVNEMAAAFGGLEGIFVYKRDPDKLTLEIPQDFEQFPAQERGLEFVVPCHMRTGGVIVYYPLSIAFGKGI